MITAGYAGLCGLILIYLSAQVIRQRRRAKIAIGSGGSGRLERAMRVQANFCEYTPMALILIGFSELSGHTPAWMLHLLLAALLAGRLIHAFGVSQPAENLRLRVTGMILTFGVITIASLTAITSSLLR